MAQKVYSYNKTGNTITSITKIIPGLDPLQLDFTYYGGKIQNATDTRTANQVPLVTFQRDINEEVETFVMHADKKQAIVKIVDDSHYNEFYKRKELKSKISEYNPHRKDTYFYFNDERVKVDKTPLSIVRELGLENIDCKGTYAKVDLIRNNDVTFEVNPTFIAGEIINVIGYDKNINLTFRVNFIYEDDKLSRMDEYSLRLDPLGNMKFLIDASFSFKYAGDKLQYINCTGTEYKRLDMQYNSIGELTAVYKTIGNLKSLFFAKKPSYIEFLDKSKIVFKIQKNSVPIKSTMIDGTDTVELNYNFNVTKNNVNRFVIPGFITPRGNISNLNMYNIDLLGEQPYLESIDYVLNNVKYFKMIPEYKRNKVYAVSIHDYNTMTKIGYIRYFYNKNLINEIITYYYKKDMTPMWVNTFVYKRNPYSYEDRAIKVEHECASTSDFKLGKYTFIMKPDYKISEIYDNYGKKKVAHIEYNTDNEVINYELILPEFTSTLNDLKMNEYFLTEDVK
jgi:hypothetical protein